MKNSNLTDRIIAILTDKPMASVDVWDALGDSKVRQSDVANELDTLWDEGRVARTITGRYCRLTAQAVAS